MTTFKGNSGNLMQHWVLCEVLRIARHHVDELTYIDAHSMAPRAMQRTESRGASRQTFDTVFVQLPGQESAYEKAWKRLSPEPGTYPNSARFVTHLWPHADIASMLLCENNPESVLPLRHWARENEDLDVEIAFEDWRHRFQSRLPVEGDLAFVSFDPDMFNRHQPKATNPRNMYPSDLSLIVEATNGCKGGVLLQLSTYSANNDNSQNEVIECISAGLRSGGLRLAACIRLDGNMMSLIYQRDVEFSDELSDLPDRFAGWIKNTHMETSGRSEKHRQESRESQSESFDMDDLPGEEKPSDRKSEISRSPFMGNRGNLMQHWVLCEVLGICRKQATIETLTFIDAHSMAPIAGRREATDERFDAVFDSLPGQESAYEMAWKELAPDPDTYPNSANFVSFLWPESDIGAMLLCETDQKTILALHSWARPRREKGLDIKVKMGDWREQFNGMLPDGSDLTFISFDPDMISRHEPKGKKTNCRNMFPRDFSQIVKATRRLTGRVLLQLSTYSAQNGNSQDDVVKCTDSLLTPAGFNLVARCWVDGQMMSLVYQRDLEFADEFSDLADRFQDWYWGGEE